MDRLLTDSEIAEIFQSDMGSKLIAVQQAAKRQRKVTLKAVGEWLDELCTVHVNPPRTLHRFCVLCGEALRNGEMPG